MTAPVEGDKEFIEAGLKQQGLTAVEWREGGVDGLVAVLGRYRAIEDDEDTGLFADDEGTLTASRVGATQYGNRRVSYVLTLDDYDEGSGSEVSDLLNVEPVE